MSYQAPLPNTGAILPVPGSGQAWEVSVYNGNFTGVENAITADRSRLTTLEGKLANNAVIPAGPAATRDGFYGTPSNAAARVALANSAPRWFNTDKGFMERYFTATSDSATGGYNQLYARATAGWKPEGAGLVPVALPTPAVTGGTAVAAGNVLLITGAATLVNLDGLFTDDFIAYKIYYDMTLSTAGFLAARMRVGGVQQAGAGSYSRQASSVVNTAFSASTSTDDKFLLSAVSSTSFLGEATIYNPAIAARATYLDTQSGRADQHARITQTRTAGADDGIALSPSNGGTMAGAIQIFGLAGGHV